jgi:hypothetical protein
MNIRINYLKPDIHSNAISKNANFCVTEKILNYSFTSKLMNWWRNELVSSEFN